MVNSNFMDTSSDLSHQPCQIYTICKQFLWNLTTIVMFNIKYFNKFNEFLTI